MLLSSLVFLWVFLPIVLIVDFLLGRLPFSRKNVNKLRNRFLLIASLVFYAWGGVYYLFLMLSIIVINYIGGILISKTDEHRIDCLVCTVTLNIGILVYFKYFNLIISTIEGIAKMERGALGFTEVVLPIGISFYIFQAMSYVIDVYRDKTEAQKNILDFGLYVSLFPQLIAGPIVQYKDIDEQLYMREESMETYVSGIKRFCYGLGKKVIIANTLGDVVDQIWKLNVGSIGWGIALLGAISYTLQIYYDFSGYSDMAIGIGRMLGFSFKENFNYPYLSGSVREFWRRWHISLSSWFREYVYIPLGGSRAGQFRTYVNLFIVFLLTGIWHGANYTFFFWGLYYAFFIILERAWLGKYLDKNRILGRIYTIIIVSVGWVFFRADSITDAFSFLGGLFRAGIDDYSALQFFSMKLLLALIFGILLGGLLQSLLGKAYENYKDKPAVRIADLVIQMAILVCSITMLMSGTYNPFIYFQF